MHARNNHTKNKIRFTTPYTVYLQPLLQSSKHGKQSERQGNRNYSQGTGPESSNPTYTSQGTGPESSNPNYANVANVL